MHRPSTIARRPRLSILWGAAAVALAFGWSVHAAAQAERTVRLEVTVDGESCFDEAVFRDRVAAQLGYAPFDEEASRALSVQVQADEEGLDIVIESGTDEGEEPDRRELVGHAGECEQLVDAAVLSVSIAIDPTAGAGSEEPAGDIDPPPPPAVEPPPVVEEPVSTDDESHPEEAAPPATVPSSSPLVAIHAALSGSLGAGPAIGSVGGRLGLEIRLGDFSVWLAARGDLPLSIAVDGGGVEAHVFGGELGACGRAAPVHLCGLAVVGATRGEGLGFFTNEQVYLPFAALGARVGVEVPIASAFFFASKLDLLAHLSPAELVVDAEVVWSMPPVSAVLSAGVLVELR